jgi:hypothetical protein
MASEPQQEDGGVHRNDAGGTRVVAGDGAAMESGAAVPSGASAIQIEAPLPFDFEQHERAAVAEYLKCQPFYADLASVVARILEECLKKDYIKVHSVQYRAKDATSLGRKAAIPSEADPTRPKYDQPIKQITDLAGIRIIAQVLGTVPEIN